MVGAVVAENRTPRGRVRTRPSPRSGRPKLGQQGRGGNPCAPACLAAHLLILLTCFAYLFCSLGGAGNHDFDGDALSLRPKRRPTLVLEDEGASRVDGVSREDSFVGLACDRAGLATLSVDEANDRSARTRRPGRPGRSLLALFALGAGELLLLFPSRKRQLRGQHGSHQGAAWHWVCAPPPCDRLWRSGG